MVTVHQQKSPANLDLTKDHMTWCVARVVSICYGKAGWPSHKLAFVIKFSFRKPKNLDYA